MGPFAGRTFLVIENNAHMRRMLCAVLDAFGAGRVLEAGDALTGYLVASSEIVDAVLLDFFLGERDGGEFVRLLRRDAASPSQSSPVIIVTALPHHPRVTASLREGADALVSKPVAPRQLYETLATVLVHTPDVKSSDLAASAVKLRRPAVPPPAPS